MPRHAQLDRSAFLLVRFLRADQMASFSPCIHQRVASGAQPWAQLGSAAALPRGRPRPRKAGPGSAGSLPGCPRALAAASTRPDTLLKVSNCFEKLKFSIKLIRLLFFMLLKKKKDFCTFFKKIWAS